MSPALSRLSVVSARSAARIPLTSSLRWLAGLALLASPATAQVKLSQVFGGGGNVGATYLSDYVELYNAGADQPLAGWSIQYASASGTTWSVRSEEHTSELQSQSNLVCRLLLEKKKNKKKKNQD